MVGVGVNVAIKGQHEGNLCSDGIVPYLDFTDG